MDLTTFLSQPIVQLGGLLGALISMQKMGFNVLGAVSSLLGIKGGVQSVNEEFRTSFQPLLSKMDELSLHFNHETTEHQERIERYLENMHNKQDKTSQLLSEIKEYGIKCRKD